MKCEFPLNKRSVAAVLPIGGPRKDGMDEGHCVDETPESGHRLLIGIRLMAEVDFQMVTGLVQTVFASKRFTGPDFLALC